MVNLIKNQVVNISGIYTDVNNLENTLQNKLDKTHTTDENAHILHLAKIDASNLTPAYIQAWKDALDVGSLPQNVATIDAPGYTGNAYDKDQSHVIFMEKANFTNSDGKVRSDMIEALGITSLTQANETSIADFAANSANYPFEDNDFIAIPNSMGTHFSLYMYSGGDKTIVNNYLPTGLTNITIAMVEGLQTALNAKLDKVTNAVTFTENAVSAANQITFTGDRFYGTDSTGLKRGFAWQGEFTETQTYIDNPVIGTSGVDLVIFYTGESGTQQRGVVDLTPFKNNVLADAAIGYKGFLKKNTAAPTVIGLYRLLETGNYPNLTPAVDEAGATIVIKAENGKLNEAYWDGTNWTQPGITLPGGTVTPIFDQNNDQDPQGGKQINDYLKLKGIIAGDNTYRFFDDFSTNKGWVENPTYPLTPVITGGIMTLSFTNGQNQGVQIPLPGMNTTTPMTFKVRIRKTTGNASILAIGTSFGTSTTNTAYKQITATNTFSEYIFNITPVTGAVSNLVIGIPSANNFGDTFEVDFFYIDEVINEGVIDFRPVLGSPNNDLVTALGNGGAVYLKPQIYTVSSSVNISSNTIIKGVKGRTIIKYTGTADFITLDETKENITFEDVIFEGFTAKTPTPMTASEVKALTGIGTQNAINLTGYAKDIHFKDCVFRNFTGCALKSSQTHTGTYNRTMKLTDCVFYGNFLAMKLGTRSEYHQFVGNSFNYNQIGAWVEGGNNFGSNNHFNANAVGLVVTGVNAQNDTHGSISTSTVNHNLSYSLFAFSINNGYTFNGCHFFQGDIYIENCRGLIISGGEIAAGIQSVSENTGYNIISNNIFVKSYNGGTITGSPTKLSMSGNRFIDGSSSITINNSI